MTLGRLSLFAALSAPTLLALCGGASAQEVSEKDYFGDLPVVLTVSRLAQPLNETPGAVTVLDRDMIRRAGARDVFDLLRLVPGFVVGHLNGANPLANYHGDFDALNRRLQVFVDGRSIYSTMLAGNVSHPMLGMVLDDIERIEVLRGSNSAGYGANAFSGVVNVVTRNAADVPRASMSLALGEQGVADRSVRVAWGDERMAFRVTAARQEDTGFENTIDDKRVDQLHVRGDLHPSPDDDIMVSAGSVRHQWGATDMMRSENWRNAYVQGRWIRHLGDGDEFRVNASFDEEKFVDQIFYISNRPFRADGTGRRMSLEAERATALTSTTRLVWGGNCVTRRRFPATCSSSPTSRPWTCAGCSATSNGDPIGSGWSMPAPCGRITASSALAPRPGWPFIFMRCRITRSAWARPRPIGCRRSTNCAATGARRPWPFRW